jgi:hypothetical protein
MAEIMADWQKGRSLQELKALAAPFKATYKPFHFGAFGLPKERDVATALDAGRLVWTRKGADPDAPADEIQAVAILRRLSSDREIRTLYGISAVAGRGDVLIEDLAFLDPAAGKNLLQHCRERGLRVFWRCNMEDPAHRELALKNEGQFVGTQVSAGSELKGWFVFPGTEKTLPDPVFPPEEIPSICRLEEAFLGAAEIEAVVREIQEFGPSWGDHYSSYNKRHSWSAIALKGYDAEDPGFIIKPDEMSRKWKDDFPEMLDRECVWTKAAELLPLTMAIVGRMPGGERNRVRIMRLSAAGELARHADVTNREAGLRDGMLARLHVPLQTNSSVKFRSWDALGIQRDLHMNAGGLWYLDQRKPHSCKNEGGHERLHLVADVEVSRDLREAIAERSRRNALV